MKLYKTRTHYCIPLSKTQWECLTRIDKDDEHIDIIPALEKAGAIAQTIEYNGHFGRNIFFAVAKERQAKRVAATLNKLLLLP